MKTVLCEYTNGNVRVIRFADGTVIRWSYEDEFLFNYPENIDVKITNRCNQGCVMCHEGSKSDGKNAENLLGQAWVNSLHPYQEIAIGGGNIFEHPDLIFFLEKLKRSSIYANITVNQVHFLQNINLIRYLVKKQLVYGVGVSLTEPNEELYQAVKEFPNVVIHVIAGMLNEEVLRKLMEHGEDIKLLILGYKRLRRGEAYYQELAENITNNIKMLEEKLPILFDSFKVVSFDCLAIEQLHVKKYVPKQIWNQFFQGDDGTMTFYIDAVNKQFAKSSTASLEDRMPIENKTIDEMFHIIRRE